MEEFKNEIQKEPMTSALVLINIVVFLLVEISGGSQITGHMLDWGAAFTPFIRDQQEYYRLFTSMFLHFGMTHLAHNMLLLFVLGGRMERTVGKIRFLIIYLAGGLTGNLVSYLWSLRSEQYAVSAGASGAVFAVMGALLYVIIRNKGHVEDLSTRQMVIMAVLSLYFGFASTGVDNAAHVGGFLGGVIVAILVNLPVKKTC